MYKIRNDAIQWQINDFLFDGNSNVCSISPHLRDVRKKNSFTLKMKVKEARSGTSSLVLDMFDSIWIFYRNFSYLGTYVFANGNTQTHNESRG